MIIWNATKNYYSTMFKKITFLANNFYTLLVLIAIVNMLWGKDLYSFVLLIIGICGFFSLKQLRLQSVDFLVLAYIGYMLISYLWSTNPYLFYLGMKEELMPIFFYFMARDMKFTDGKFIKNMWWPMLFAFACGIYLWWRPPGWYLDFRINRDLTWLSDERTFEVTRLSSFWTWSYFVGYSSLILLMYFIHRFVFYGEKVKCFWIGIAITIIAMLLAQQRSSIAFFALYMTALMGYGVIKGKVAGKHVFYFGLSSIAIIGIFIFFITQYVGSEYVEFVLSRFESTDHSLVTERYNQFSDQLVYFTFLGGGMGTFGHSAFAYDLPCSADNDYFRIILAYGIPGTLILMLILFATIKNGLRNIYENFFYLSCVGFMIIAATGADVTEKYTLQSFVWWYAIGMIQTNTLGYTHSIIEKK